MILETSFPHSYGATLSEIPATDQPRYYYPGASLTGGKDGLVVATHAHCGKCWIGVFAFGDISGKGTSGLFTTPDPDRLCVISRGVGYLVDANIPEKWEAIRSIPILDVRLIPSHCIIVFANYTELVAYGLKGIVWRTKRLAWDGLKITEVTGSHICGEYEDVQTEQIGTFMVDLSNGSHEGGIEEMR